jgi:hypothetical protein
VVRDWTPVQQDWIRVKLKGHGKSKPKRYIFINRLSKQVRHEDPAKKVTKKAEKRSEKVGEK